MNDLKLNATQTINSREVAEMMEMRHGDLLAKIDKINEDFNNGNISCQNYWIESTFENRGKQYRCYEVTKLGCDFLAYKRFGKNGNVFTARYFDKFEEMNAVINSDEELEKQLLYTIYKGGIESINAVRELIALQNKTLIEENTDLQNKIDFMQKDLATIKDFNRVSNVLVDLIDKKSNTDSSNRQRIWNNLFTFMKNAYGIDVAERQHNKQVKLDTDYFKKTGKHYSIKTLRTKVSKESTIKDNEYSLFLDVLKARALDLGITVEELDNALSF